MPNSSSKRYVFTHINVFHLHVIQKAWMRGEIMALGAKRAEPRRPVLFCSPCLSTRLKAILVPLLLSLAVVGFSLSPVWAFGHPGAWEPFCSAQSWLIPALCRSHTSFILCHSCLWLSAVWSECLWVCVCVCLPELSLLYPSASSSCLGASSSTPLLSRGMAAGPAPAAPGTCTSGHQDAG